MRFWSNLRWSNTAKNNRPRIKEGFPLWTEETVIGELELMKRHGFLYITLTEGIVESWGKESWARQTQEQTQVFDAIGVDKELMNDRERRGLSDCRR